MGMIKRNLQRAVFLFLQTFVGTAYGGLTFFEGITRSLVDTSVLT